MPQRKNIFICLTPLHVLYAIAFKEKNKRDNIILIDQKGSLHEFAKAINSDTSEEKIEYFDSKKNKKTNILDYITYKTTLTIGKLSKIAATANQSPTDKLFLFNDLSPEAQYLAKKINHSESIYIEDGSAPYNEHYITRSTAKNTIISIFFGFYEKINILGTSSAISRSLFSFPEIVRSENTQKPHSRLELETSKIIALKSIFQKELTIEAPATLILSPSKSPTEEFIKNLNKNEEIKINKITKINSAIKRHPLDTKNRDIQNEIKSYIPAELIPAIYPEIKSVVGSRSTALQNIKTLYPHLDIYNVAPPPKTSYDEKLEKIGIKHVTPPPSTKIQQ